jgi:hypothetical protein
MSQRKLVFAVSMFASVSLLASCSSKKTTASPDASVAIDAFVTPIDAPPPCLISSMDFGTKGALANGTSSYDPGTPMTAGDPAFPNIRMQAPLSAGAKPDIVIVELLTGFAPFGTGTAPIVPKPGTYPLTGPQLNYETCGTCVRAVAAVDTNTDGGDFFATGGTLVVTEVGTKVGDKFTLELQNVTFEQVTYAAMTFRSTPVGNNCKTKIVNATYTGTMVAPPPAKPTTNGQEHTRYKLTRVN